MYPLLRKVEQKENRLVGAKPYLRDSLKIYNSNGISPYDDPCRQARALSPCPLITYLLELEPQ